jgi:membrane-bound lytic murein transglycosylase A
MDSALMPKGSLVYIKTAIPYKKNDSDMAIPRDQRKPFEKFFFVQDTGGAIKGGGRVDIYFGEGDDAFFYAGQMAGRGEIYLLVAKKEVLEKGEVKK